jgi:hypothetical protein
MGYWSGRTKNGFINPDAVVREDNNFYIYLKLWWSTSIQHDVKIAKYPKDEELLVQGNLEKEIGKFMDFYSLKLWKDY